MTEHIWKYTNKYIFRNIGESLDSLIVRLNMVTNAYTENLCLLD